MDPEFVIKVATAYFLSKETVGRILGPTFDLYGEELRQVQEQYLSRRRENLTRVFTNAEKKLGDRINKEGVVPAKVLKEILDDGSYAEDALAADYFGGVLASSRSGVARDDRGAAFVKLVGGLSVYQLRMHFILYRLVRELFVGKAPAHKFYKKNHPQMEIYLPITGYLTAMEFEDEEDPAAILVHVMHGLSRDGLIGSFTSGSMEHLKQQGFGAPDSGILFLPSSPGAELFLWAHGQGHQHVHDFLDPEVILDLGITIPAIQGAQGTSNFTADDWS